MKPPRLRRRARGAGAVWLAVAGLLAVLIAAWLLDLLPFARRSNAAPTAPADVAPPAATPPASPTANRVVTLAPHLAELVCAAGGCGELIAVGAYTDYPSEAAAKPVLGDVAALNYEALLGLKATQVYVWDGGTPAQQLARLAALRFPVRKVRTETLDDVATALRSIGAELGHAAEAEAAAARYSARIAALRERYAGQRPVRVFYQIEARPAYTVSGASPISQVIALCGGVNVLADLPTLAAPVSTEAVLAAKPEAVLHAAEDSEAIRADWQRFATLPLVRQGHFYGVPAALLTRAGPRLADGAEAVCTALAKVRADTAATP